MCHNTEEWCKIWGGTDFSFEKRHEKFEKTYFSTHFNGLLWRKVYNDWAKKIQKSYVMTLKGDAIFK